VVWGVGAANASEAVQAPSLRSDEAVSGRSPERCGYSGIQNNDDNDDNNNNNLSMKKQ
jgi:hypothetical protein